MRALVRPGASGAAGVAELRQRLGRLGVTDVGVISPSDPATELAAIAGALRGRTLLVDADLLVTDACLGQLVDDPRVRSGALVVASRAGGTRARRQPAADPGGGAADAVAAATGSVAGGVTSPVAAVALAPELPDVPEPEPGPDVRLGERPLGRACAVRAAHGRIISASSAVHDVEASGHASVGALVVDATDRDHAAKVLTAAADTARFAGWDGDPVDLALVALVRGQVPMAAVDAVGPVLRGGSEEQRIRLTAELDAVDEAALLLERAQRPSDGAYARLVRRRAARPVTSLALRLRLMPNVITLLSLIVALAAAGCFAWGTWPALLGGAVLLQVSLVLGCVDGDVARFTRSSTRLGAWLDAATEPVKEFAAYAGLAIGAARSGQDLWLLATLAIALQTVRHVGDHGFGAVQRVRESWVPARPLLDTSDADPAQTLRSGPDAPSRTGASGPDGSAWTERERRVVPELLSLPLAERWLVLGVGAATIGARWTFLLLLGLGLVAWGVTTSARVAHSLRWRQPGELHGNGLLSGQLDLGPLGEPLWNLTLGRLRPLARRLGWIWPTGMRVVELGTLWWVVSRVAPSQGAWLFAWTFVVALHHHDLPYRVLAGAPPPRWLSWFGLGWEGRTILVLLAGWSGAAALSGLLHVGVPVLALLFIVVSSVQWVRSLNRRSGRTVRA